MQRTNGPSQVYQCCQTFLSKSSQIFEKPKRGGTHGDLWRYIKAKKIYIQGIQGISKVQNIYVEATKNVFSMVKALKMFQ